MNLRKTTMMMLAMLMTASLALTGCLQGESPSGPGSEAVLRARINGDLWTAVLPAGTRLVPPYEITLVGSGNGNSVAINVMADAAGTYPMGGVGSESWASIRWNQKEYTTKELGCSGKVVIHEYDEDSKQLTGTFSFLAKNSLGESISVTEGTFSKVRWSEQ